MTTAYSDLDLGAWHELCAQAREIFAEFMGEWGGASQDVGRAYTATYDLIMSFNFAWKDGDTVYCSPMLAKLAAHDALNYWRWFWEGFLIDECACCSDDGRPLLLTVSHVALLEPAYAA